MDRPTSDAENCTDSETDHQDGEQIDLYDSLELEAATVCCSPSNEADCSNPGQRNVENQCPPQPRTAFAKTAFADSEAMGLSAPDSKTSDPCQPADTKLGSATKIVEIGLDTSRHTPEMEEIRSQASVRRHLSSTAVEQTRPVVSDPGLKTPVPHTCVFKMVPESPGPTIRSPTKSTSPRQFHNNSDGRSSGDVKDAKDAAVLRGTYTISEFQTRVKDERKTDRPSAKNQEDGDLKKDAETEKYKEVQTLSSSYDDDEDADEIFLSDLEVEGHRHLDVDTEDTESESSQSEESEETGSKSSQSERSEEMGSKSSQSEKSEDTESKSSQSEGSEETDSKSSQSERSEGPDPKSSQSEREEPASKSSPSERSEETYSKSSQSEGSEDTGSKSSQSESNQNSESAQQDSVVPGLQNLIRQILDVSPEILDLLYVYQEDQSPTLRRHRRRRNAKYKKNETNSRPKTLTESPSKLRDSLAGRTGGDDQTENKKDCDSEDDWSTVSESYVASEHGGDLMTSYEILTDSELLQHGHDILQEIQTLKERCSLLDRETEDYITRYLDLEDAYVKEKVEWLKVTHRPQKLLQKLEMQVARVQNQHKDAKGDVISLQSEVEQLRHQIQCLRNRSEISERPSFGSVDQQVSVEGSADEGFTKFDGSPSQTNGLSTAEVGLDRHSPEVASVSHDDHVVTTCTPDQKDRPLDLVKINESPRNKRRNKILKAENKTIQVVLPDLQHPWKY